MALKFYIQVKGKVSGPLIGSELKSLAQSGKLLPTDMVRQDGSDKWVQANRIRNLDFGASQEEPVEEIEEILEASTPNKTTSDIVRVTPTETLLRILDTVPRNALLSVI